MARIALLYGLVACAVCAVPTPAFAARCGDGVCTILPNGTGERAATCPQDCFCGDGLCYPRDGETSARCPADCACGDGCCDRDEQFTYNACASDCHAPYPSGQCGNGCLNDGETCDYAGYWMYGDYAVSCTPETTTGDSCVTAPPVCGNGIVEIGELCDDGSLNSDVAPNACRTSCRTAFCRDGVLDVGEACDDGNDVSGDGCDNNCAHTGCGNNVITAPEECDDGNGVDADGCDSNCRPTGCPNGVVTGTESCDDGNTSNEDGCLSTCIPNVCGDSQVNRLMLAGVPVEVCDDGDTADGDACSYDCRKDLTRCGNQALEAGEVCDFGVLNTLQPDAVCRPTCEVPRCGDGVVDVVRGESCDSTPGCAANCAATAP